MKILIFIFILFNLFSLGIIAKTEHYNLCKVVKFNSNEITCKIISKNSMPLDRCLYLKHNHKKLKCIPEIKSLKITDVKFDGEKWIEIK